MSTIVAFDAADNSRNDLSQKKSSWRDDPKVHPAASVLPSTEPIPLASIRDGGAQMRVEVRPETVNEYATEMLDGAAFPPVVVFYDGSDFWLADGFHRVEAKRKIGHETIIAEIREGSSRDAILHGAGSNSSHGLRRTQADKRRAVERLLKDPEWARWSDRKIAEVAKVDHKTVGTIRRELTGEFPTTGLVDRRNDEPMIFAENMETDPDQEIQVGSQVQDDEPLIEEVKTPELPELPWLYLDVDEPVQKYIVEVWIEKSTQNDWLVPLCRRRGVNLVIGIGEQSEIRSRELALRSAKYGAPVRIIYISDFDPGGRSMPKAVARKVEFTTAKFNLDVDLQLIPLALTPDQCREYRLPRTPIKDTEKRKDKFEQIFGVGATELDAMEALNPGELARLLEAELNNWLDPSLNVRFQRLRSDLRLRLRTIEEGIHAHHAGEIESLKTEFETITDEFASVTYMFDDWEERARELWQTVAGEIDEQRPDLSDVEVPRSQAPGETDRFVLFDSRRDYFTQMDAYNAWRDGDENGEAGTA
jgi:hypothetical protein